MNPQLQSIAEELVQNLGERDTMFSLIFSEENPATGNAIISKAGENGEIISNLAAVILGGISNTNQDIARQAADLLFILENTLITIMMEDNHLYQLITQHIVNAKNKASNAMPMMSKVMGEA